MYSLFLCAGFIGAVEKESMHFWRWREISIFI